MDEPTAVLTPQEAAELFDNLKKLVATGRSVVLITHKLNEVLPVAQRVTVLRGGRVVAVLDREDIPERKLARLMVGRDLKPAERQGVTSPAGAVLELERVGAMKDVGRHVL